MHPELQRACHYIVSHCVKVWHVSLGGANNMHPLSWRGGGGGGGGGASNGNDATFERIATQLLFKIWI